MSRGLFGYVSGSDVVTSYAYADTQYVTEIFTNTGSNTWTVPTGVTYIIANIVGGGGGDGGTTSIAFAAGTQSALGGKGHYTGRGGFIQYGVHILGVNNSGQGGFMSWATTSGPNSGAFWAKDGQIEVVDGVVTPGSGITVTIGAGGSSQSGNSGSGVAWVEYYVP